MAGRAGLSSGVERGAVQEGSKTRRYRRERPAGLGGRSKDRYPRHTASAPQWTNLWWAARLHQPQRHHPVDASGKKAVRFLSGSNRTKKQALYRYVTYRER